MDEPAGGRCHIVLVGMMGVGKTTAGRRLASRLDRRFVDLDAELERRSGRSVRSWFAEDGEAAFRDAEAALLSDVLASPEPVVAASGGGVVCRAENRSRLAGRDVVVVWLDATPAFLESRLAERGGGGHRPLLDDDPRTTLERLHTDRGPLYAEVADVTVSVDQVVRHTGGSPKARVLDAVLAELERHGVMSTGTPS